MLPRISASQDVAKFVKDDFMANDPTSDSFSLIALAPVQAED